MSKEPFCAKEHASNPVTTEGVIAGSTGGLKWVVVYISEGLDPASANQVPSVTPTFDQKNCQYIPHVMAVDVNQHFKVVNSDPHSHNIHPLPAPGGPNHEWNKSQPQGAPPIRHSLDGARKLRFREVQHPSLDERLYGGRERSVGHQRRER